jgi:hypothetical protein
MRSRQDDMLRQAFAGRAYEAPDEDAGVHAARALFFQAVHRVEPRVVGDLMGEPLALSRLIIEAGLAGVPEDQRHRRRTGEWFPSWGTIAYASDRDPKELHELRAVLLHWAHKWRLEDDWCLEAAVETLAILSAAGDTAEPQPLHYLGTRMIESPFAASELRFEFSDSGWSPTLTSWEVAEQWIDWHYREVKKAYRERIDALCREQELQPVRGTKVRAGDHFEWVARYQVGRELWTEIAEVETKRLKARGKRGVSADAVAKAVREKAQLLGLTLAEVERPGRPKRSST